MPRMGVPKESLTPPENLPGGVYQFRCDGFKPQMTKPKDPSKSPSINYCPQLVVINNPGKNSKGESLNGKRIMDFLNQNAGWIVQDFVHSLGAKMVEENGEVNIPGTWTPSPSAPDDVTKMTYSGVLIGRTGTLELAEVTDPSNPAKKYMNVKRYLCAVPGCQEKHSDNLLRA